MKELKAKKELAEKLAHRHCELSPIGKINFSAIVLKISALLDNWDTETVREAIEQFSPKGTQGDGLGVVFMAIKKGLVESKKRHEAEAINITKANAERPTGKPIAFGLEQRFKITDYGVIDEKSTQEEKQRQYRALRESEAKRGNSRFYA